MAMDWRGLHELYGVPGTATFLASRALRRVGLNFRPQRVMARPITGSPTPRPPLPPGLVLRPLERADFGPEDGPIIDKRLSHPALRAFGVMSGPRRVAIGWVSLARTGLEAAPPDLDFSQALYLWSDHTAASHRRLQLHQHLIAARLELGAALGKRMAFATVDIWNRASFASFQCAGFSHFRWHIP
jgi:hypothetical protein